MPKPSPSKELFPELPEPSATSGKAKASLALGILFIFACLSGVPAIILGWLALRDIDRSGGRLRGKGMAVSGIVLGLVGCLFTIALLMPLTRQANEAVRRAQCVNNLKQIGYGMHNYHDAHGRLPAAAIVDKDGKPLLSWRVALLSSMEGYSTLYEQFHLDEPWDSPHNRSLLGARPSVYACPSDPTLKAGMTGYQVVIGPTTAFTPDFRPVRLADFTDGPGYTLLVGESRRPVPWTKPEDLAFDGPLPLAGLGSHHGHHYNGFNASFADGSVKFLKSTIDPGVLRALLTRNGNEPVSAESY